MFIVYINTTLLYICSTSKNKIGLESLGSYTINIISVLRNTDSPIRHLGIT